MCHCRVKDHYIFSVSDEEGTSIFGEGEENITGDKK
jgi:hypothetical protein